MNTILNEEQVKELLLLLLHHQWVCKPYVKIERNYQTPAPNLIALNLESKPECNLDRDVVGVFLKAAQAANLSVTKLINDTLSNTRVKQVIISDVLLAIAIRGFSESVIEVRERGNDDLRDAAASALKRYLRVKQDDLDPIKAEPMNGRERAIAFLFLNEPIAINDAQWDMALRSDPCIAVRKAASARIQYKPIRRALVLSGGGAKGAYAFGCLKAFKKRDIQFDAVSGTSVGGLNAMLWSTDSLGEGQKLWDELSFSTVYPVRFLNPSKFPKFLIRPLAMIIVLLHLIVSTTKGIRHPASLLTSLLLTIALGFPYLVYLLAVGSWFSENIDGPNVDIWILCVVPTLLALGTMFKSFYKGKLVWAALLIIFWIFVEILRFGSLLAGVLGTGEEGVKYVVALCFACGVLLVVLVIKISAVSDYFLGMIGTVLDSTPLSITVNNILSSKSISIPTFITTAALHDVYDPDSDISWWQRAWESQDIYYEPGPSKMWVPYYTNISTLSPEEAAFHSVATASLPFGIVPPVKMQDNVFVDGGVVDNIPFYPFASDIPVQEIYIVILETFKSDEDAQTFSNITPGRWSELERLKRVVALPKPPPRQGKYRSIRTVEFKSPKHFPKLIFFYPRREGLGNFLTGTLNFNADYAKAIMKQGCLETLEKLDELAKAAHS